MFLDNLMYLLECYAVVSLMFIGSSVMAWIYDWK